MPQIPRDPNPDSTLALLSDGYQFISKRCRRYRSDLFETRLMLRRAVCMTGEEAARAFYHGERFTRRGAMPQTTLRLLQDKGSVQLLDGEAHRHRKQMFMSLMSPAAIQALADEVENQWYARIGRWEGMNEVVLLPEVEEILTRAVCRWAGVPLDETEASQRTREFGAMIAGSGGIGPRNWWGMLLRARTERWIRDVIERVRSGDFKISDGSAAHVVAWHRNLNGELLDTKDAAVELINVLRPTMAVARFVTFAALAVHEHPECRQKLESGNGDYAELFVQEVRRFYPFFPFIGGRVQEEFNWRGHHFARGTWVILDMYGTNHDVRIWAEPDTFRPERFRDWDGSAFNFIPQGGGDFHTDHRCPGEWITIELIKRAVRLLTSTVHYDVPAQDLRVDLARFPAEPKSQFVITNVRQIPASSTPNSGSQA
ncbi:cytochrome P450 [Aurantimonas coralicida]|uniref:cytochrome P450 n=1 Tax=Aurantimonas coralicida TaxID=182270 RepID=UPI001D189A99|nr:cytochrome P450 [Aurantimonas coralicida]MCC4300087.1 cytochrome P450 [Aurantimonas coralicida]